jgi:hypothetical protein
MDVPPPQQPAPPPPQPQYIPKSSGVGCFGAGCLTLLVIGFLFIAALVGGSWYLVTKGIDMFTSPQPVDVAMPMPTEAEYTAANEKSNQLRTALRNKQGATFTFTAAELNALIARDPDLVPHKGKVRFAIDDSIATVEMSVPLDTIDFPRVKRRWFNGSANFSFIYADEGFRFDANWLEANGHRISGSVLRYAADGFNRSFSRSFEESVDRDGNSEFWRNIKTMTLDEDKLVIITRGE